MMMVWMSECVISKGINDEGGDRWLMIEWEFKRWKSWRCRRELIDELMKKRKFGLKMISWNVIVWSDGE